MEKISQGWYLYKSACISAKIMERAFFLWSKQEESLNFLELVKFIHDQCDPSEEFSL